MKIIDNFPHFSFNNLPPLTLAFGDFDGLHLGHQLILQKVLSFKDTKSALINFIPNSKAFFQNQKDFYLTSYDQKVTFYRFLGFDYLFLWRWSKKLTFLTKDRFIALLKQNNVKRVIITKEARFGYQKQGNYQDLIKYFEVCLIDDYVKPKKGQQKVSSTYIKNLLSQGKIKEANLSLGKPYLIQGKVILGQQRGRQLGFRTANLDCSNYFLPLLGVYAVLVTYKRKKYRSIANLGVRPTFDSGNKKLLEVHLFDFEKDLYGKTITVEFIAFLRAEKKFANVSELIEQIKADIILAKSNV
ncbi:riboflavin biosynthesis protein RibF [Candidatus Phytoplasma solani]|uniref:Riboflavin biosynthesis protein n=2 Tax=Candidatus Phytoplasma solani TaxID=69896 RepID=A0A421NV58_9MOLU|nr:riboflavin biosynthesis protein RibF [Candidatus Phytoplasma solani]RMI87865.1 riboflavin kinase [Candidatus Phytoplasma solani]CCP88312.1 riboflavin kinase [Candidatus Phytoplasma solani]CCP88735.1 Riboflavin biosynthesis protein RibF [Candidatus Phytoplasma solani]